MKGGQRAFGDFLDEAERSLLTEALRESNGNQSAAAQLLGLPRPTLHAKLRKHGIGRGLQQEP
jgi:two-component system C4-dicarboxylate transport response regulator DctD